MLEAQLLQLDRPPVRPDRTGPLLLGLLFPPALLFALGIVGSLGLRYINAKAAARHVEAVSAPTSAPEPAQIGGTWYAERSASPWLVDVNGDGTKDLVGVAWLYAGKIQVVAYDGVTFQRIWNSASFPGTWASEVTHLAVAGDKVVVSDAADTVHVLSLQTGAQEREAELNGGVWSICANPKTPGAVLLGTKPYGSEPVRMDLTTGAMGKTAPTERCFRWSNDNRQDESQVQRTDETIHKKSAVRGFQGTDTYGYGDFRVTIGSPYGEGVPPHAGPHMLGWDQGTRSVRWEHALLPAGDESRERSHTLADDDTVYYSYQTSHTPKLGPHRLVAWSIVTGEQRWKATLPESAEGSLVSYVGLGSGHLFVQLDRRMLVLDTKTGAVQKEIEQL
jgi:hypothetical protein